MKTTKLQGKSPRAIGGSVQRLVRHLNVVITLNLSLENPSPLSVAEYTCELLREYLQNRPISNPRSPLLSDGSKNPNWIAASRPPSRREKRPAARSRAQRKVRINQKRP